MIINVALLCYRRPYLTALAVAYYAAYRMQGCRLYAFVDGTALDTVDVRTVALLQKLHAYGLLEDLQIEGHNRGASYMVSRAAVELIERRGCDYFVRLEDDILLGPGSLRTMIDCIRRSQELSAQLPIALLSGYCTDRIASLRPVRFRRIGPYTVGIAGLNCLEGLTVVRTDVGSRFDWRLEHGRAFNSVWLTKLRASGFEGGSMVSPTICVQHIGYHSTVPRGNPVVPACVYGTQEPVTIPHFEWSAYFKLPEVQERQYVEQVLRRVGAILPTDLFDILMTVFDEPSPVTWQPTAYDPRFEPTVLKPAIPVSTSVQSPVPKSDPGVSRRVAHVDI